MDDALVVGVLQRLADRRDDGERLFGFEFAVAQQVAEVHAVDEFHDEIEESAGFAEVVDGDDVRVVELGEQFGLAGEALGETSPRPTRSGGEDLDGDDPVERFLAGLVNHAHAAAAEAFEDFELGNLSAISSGDGGGARGSSPLESFQVREASACFRRHAEQSKSGELLGISAPHSAERLSSWFVISSF